MAPISVLVADDEDLTRSALVALLRLEPDIEIVAECPDGRVAVEQARRHGPDVALADLEMPHLDGVEACEQPAGLPTHVGVLTRHARPGLWRRGPCATTCPRP